MRQDEIIDEVRAARAKLLEECGGDLALLFARLQELEAKEGRQVVVGKPRRVVRPKNDVA